jgi:Tfp pilus assembly protein PilN
VSESTHIATEPESAAQPDLPEEPNVPVVPAVLDVLIVPAEYFFVERIEVPPAVTSGELADYAELSMEGLAPFPLDQLRWGFLTAADGQHILIYAALFDRLKRAGYKNLEDYTWVLPDFAALHGARFAAPTEVVLRGETHDTRLQYPAGENLPLQVDSLPCGEAATTKGALELALNLVELTEKGTPTFHFDTLGGEATEGHWSPLAPNEAGLWQADIRPADFKSVERSVRRTTALITRIMGYSAIAALCLVVLEGLFFMGQFWLGTRQAKIESQTTAVRRIQDKESLMSKLEQVAQNELRPIAILEAANRVRISLGTTGIEYDEVVIEGGNRLTIEGKANTINELNAYTEALRKSGSFELVETPKYITRSGQTTFTATLDYRHSEPPAQTSPTSTPISPETEETSG